MAIPLPNHQSVQAVRDERMTANRMERKYLVERAAAGALQRRLDQHLSRHTHSERELPGAQLYATTVYFDTRSRHLFRQATSADEGVKLRAREYYAIDPSMVQLARRPEELVRFDRVLWFELKYRQRGHVQKRRFGIPKPDVPGFLSDGRITVEMVDVQARDYGEKARRVLREASGLCQHYGEPFGVDCLVNYRRVAWQDAAGTLRVTLDRDLRAYRAPDDLWTRQFALSAEALGQPSGVFGKAILEIKSRGPLPVWIDDALSSVGAESSDFSKFVTASRSVHSGTE